MSKKNEDLGSTEDSVEGYFKHMSYVKNKFFTQRKWLKRIALILLVIIGLYYLFGYLGCPKYLNCMPPSDNKCEVNFICKPFTQKVY